MMNRLANVNVRRWSILALLAGGLLTQTTAGCTPLSEQIPAFLQSFALQVLAASVL